MGFGEADAGEVAEGGFNGGVGEEVDDGFLAEGNAGDVDEWKFAAAAETAEQGGFAGAGRAGEEDDLAGGWRSEMREWGSGELGRGMDAKPFGHQRAVGLGRCASWCGGRLQCVNFVNFGRVVERLSGAARVGYGFVTHSHSPLWCCAIDATELWRLWIGFICLNWASSFISRERRSHFSR